MNLRKFVPVLMIVGLALMACGGTSGGGGGTTAVKKIALLLPEATTARYDTKDMPYFKAKLASLCSSCQLIYSNAKQDAPTQQTQAEAAITNGASVIVLDPVDGAAAAAIVTKAKAANIPVISYDRLILNTADLNYYLSFDNAAVGALQGNALLTALNGKANASVVEINGDPADNNAKLFKQGAHSVLDGKVNIKREYDTPGWKPANATTEMQGALTALGNKVDGVLAANDGTAGGAISAMKSAHVTPWPPVTGQDAELAGIQRILAGEQYMTVYKAIKAEAEAAAVLAFDLATGVAVPADMTAGKTVNNGKADIKSVLLTPVAVIKANIQATVVKDGFWTATDICTTVYAAACTAAGIS
ncbi:MAG: substrate-binding domain-containing protein [Candidatus Dormibacteraeota bacterium]|nr:substrate-binding domain-containing protein [Candidatus Dormibacteraeota bacterium]